MDGRSVLLSVLALTDDGIVVSADGLVSEVNGAGAVMLGWNEGPALTLGRPLDEVLDRSHPTDTFGLPMTGEELRQRAAAAHSASVSDCGPRDDERHEPCAYRWPRRAAESRSSC
jgi:hypothetical protein